MVIGDRQTDTIEHFSPLKKRLQRLGSAVVRRASGTGVPDATSGFRAYNREAALQLQVVSKFTYTLESLIQAGQDARGRRARRRCGPTSRRARRGCSRRCGRTSAATALSIFRIYALYEPLRVFMAAAALVALVGVCIWARFAWFFVSGEGGGHVQSLILGATLFIVAVQLAALGVVGDILAGSRVLQQRILERVRRVELQLGVEPSHYEPGRREPAASRHHRRQAGPRRASRARARRSKL